MSFALLPLLVTLAAPLAGAKRPAWCAVELKTLDGDICVHDEPAPEGEPRVLVIFLHGLVKTGTNWQHHHQRQLVRAAKRKGFTVLMPRGIDGGHPHYPNKVGWPVTTKDLKKHEPKMFARWKAAQAKLEADGKPFDRVVVMGFSSGAYYDASLALRGALKVDGHAVFGGGGAWGGLHAEHRPPIFVGICSKDRTAAGAEQLVKALEKADWPHEAKSLEVGHTLVDEHLDAAVAYLRGVSVE